MNKLLTKINSLDRTSKVLLPIIIVIGLLLRTIPQWDKVFVNGQVLFREVDTWYHMRLVDAMVHNFPHPLTWDMYSLYPNGGYVGFFPFITTIIASSSKLGLNYEIFGALLPSIIGSLIAIPIFFIGRELFNNKGIGLLAALIAIILPSELLHRSLLGFTDHHVFEAFLASWFILFVILAEKRKNWKWNIGAGVSLGLYVINWYGSPLLLVMIGIWLLVKVIYSKFKNLPLLPIGRDFSLILGISICIATPILHNFLTAKITLLILPAMLGIVWILIVTGHVRNKWVFLGIILSLVTIALVVINSRYNLYYQLIGPVFGGRGSTISEAQPLNPTIAMSTYGVPFFLMFGGLFFAIKKKINSFFLLFSITMLVASFCQVRWAYYFTVPLSILASYMCFKSLDMVTKKARAAALTVLCVFTIIPSIKSIGIVINLPNNITPSWNNALVWLRNNTPEPFSSPDVYYELNIQEKPSYSIMSWWDYGHWITRIARRVPMSNPGYQDEYWSPRFFSSTDPKEASEILRENNVKYIIYDSDVIAGKFHAIEEKAGVSVTALSSMAYRLWTEDVPGYRLVWSTPAVKIFEYIGEESGS